MKKIYSCFKKYRAPAFFAPLCKLTEALLELTVPLIVAKIIDVGIANRDAGYVLKMVILMAGIGLLGLGFSIMGQFFSARCATGYAGDLRKELFEKTVRFPFFETDKMGVSTLITRLTSDCNQVQTGVNMLLRLLLRSPFVVFGAWIMAITIDPSLSLVFLVAVPVLFAVVFAILLTTMPRYRENQVLLDSVTDATRENLTGVRVIRAFGAEERFLDDYQNRTDRLYRSQNKVSVISAFLNPVTYVVVNAAIVAILWFGGLRVDAGSLTQGQVIALYQYMGQILVELIKMANLIITMSKSVACLKRVSSTLETAAAYETMPAAEGQISASALNLACNGQATSAESAFSGENETFSAGGKQGNSAQVSAGEKAGNTAGASPANVSGNGVPYLVFDHVSMRYPGGGNDAISEISFTVNRGETVGVIGGTGSGKSTLVSLLPRFYDATGGAVYLEGQNLKTLPPEELRKRFGFVMQRAELFTGTVRDNLLFSAPNASDEDIEEALSVSQSKEFVDQKPGGLDYEVEQHGRNFSGGQKQRLSVARALVRKPEILVLDDSASALDYATEARMRKALRHLSFRPTTFIVSQRTASIRKADKILVLDQGKLVGVGTHEELLRSCPVYAEIASSQEKGGDGNGKN